MKYIIFFLNVQLFDKIPQKKKMKNIVLLLSNIVNAGYMNKKYLKC